MAETIDRTTDNGTTGDRWIWNIQIPEIPRRRPTKPGEVVVRTVEELHALGMKRPEIARELGMTAGYNGSLPQALRRAGRLDLLAAITTPGYDHRSRQGAAERIAAPAAEELPVDDSDESTPRGRPVRGPGGIVRWVAA